MIFLYTGKTGSGKTFQMVKDIYPQWKKGRDVYANTKLFFEKFGGKKNVNIVDNPEEFTRMEKLWDNIKLVVVSKLFKKDLALRHRGNIVYFDDISELIEIKDGIIAMDEAQNLLDSRNWENLPMEFSNKLRQHRKHNLDLYATTQNMGTIDINMRRLVQKWKHSRDIFALFWLRNPSLLTIHSVETKDIDFLYNNVDDLQVPTLKKNYFIIHRWKKRFYDTLWDIGFNFYKIIWIQHNKKKLALIIPKNWNLTKARTALLLQKYYFDRTKFMTGKKSKTNYENIKEEKKDIEQRTSCNIVTEHNIEMKNLKKVKEKLERMRKEKMNMD